MTKKALSALTSAGNILDLLAMQGFDVNEQYAILDTAKAMLHVWEQERIRARDADIMAAAQAEQRANQ